MQQAMETRREGAVTIIRLQGEHDVGTVDAVDRVVRAALADVAAAVVLDLSAVDLIDSRMIAALIRWSVRAQQPTGRQPLAIVVPPDSAVARTLTVVQVADRLPVFETTDAALAALP